MKKLLQSLTWQTDNQKINQVYSDPYHPADVVSGKRWQCSALEWPHLHIPHLGRVDTAINGEEDLYSQVSYFKTQSLDETV